MALASDAARAAQPSTALSAGIVGLGGALPERVVLAAAGSGFTWGATVVEWGRA